MGLDNNYNLPSACVEYASFSDEREEKNSNDAKGMYIRQLDNF